MDKQCRSDPSFWLKCLSSLTGKQERLFNRPPFGFCPSGANVSDWHPSGFIDLDKNSFTFMMLPAALMHSTWWLATKQFKYCCNVSRGHRTFSQYLSDFRILLDHDLLGSRRWNLYVHTSLYTDVHHSNSALYPLSRSIQVTSINVWVQVFLVHHHHIGYALYK